MNRTMMSLTAVAVGGAGVMLGRRLLRHTAPTARDDGRDRWHSVTVNCPPEQLRPKPSPLDEIGFPVEILYFLFLAQRRARVEVTSRSAGRTPGGRRRRARSGS